MALTLVKKKEIVFPEVSVPDLPSELFEEVVNDMRKVAKLRHVTFNMSTWFDAFDNKCEVCAAGAWLYAKTNYNDFKSNITFMSNVQNENDSVMEIMELIDNVRSDVYDEGNAHYFLILLGRFGRKYGLKNYKLARFLDKDDELTRLGNLLSEDLSSCYTKTYNQYDYHSVVAMFKKVAKVFRNYGL